MHYSQRLLGCIKRAEQATQAAKEQVLREFAMTAAQQSALAVLSDHEGITAAELARKCGVTPQTMNSTLGRLQRAGLVDRQAHPVHGTLIEVRLSPRGRAAFAQADAQVADLDAALTQGLDDVEVAQLKVLLEQICRNAQSATAAS